MPTPKSIKNFSLLELEQIILSLGYQKFNARQIFSWMYKKLTDDFGKMSDLPAGLKELLKKKFITSAVFVKDKLQSKDGTQKLLFELSDGNFIEGVIIPSRDRVTGCVSSQAGCKYGCSFCASGSAGFERNLTAAEIIDEVLCLKKNSQSGRLTHLVFMGTGEPFDNYDNVLKSARIINSPEGLNIGARRITISTSGLIPGIEKLAKENLQVELSVSLHASDDKTRSLIMPVNKIYPLKDLLNACKKYIKQTNRQVTFEYIMIKGLNSDLQSARKLGKLLIGMNCKVNLIPANTVWEFKTNMGLSRNAVKVSLPALPSGRRATEGSAAIYSSDDKKRLLRHFVPRNDTKMAFRNSPNMDGTCIRVAPPDNQDILLFKGALVKSGLNITLRRPRGQDIEAACGQLRLKYEKK